MLSTDEQVYGKYRYSFYVTNLTLPVESIWKLYRGSSDSENRIKVIKYDFGADCR